MRGTSPPTFIRCAERCRRAGTSWHRRARRLTVVLSVVGVWGGLAAGCRKSPPRRAEEKRQTIHSWESTLRAADSAGAKGAVPRRFLERLRKTARREMAAAGAG